MDLGRYIFASLFQGVYEVKVSASGFRTFTRTHIVVTADTVRQR